MSGKLLKILISSLIITLFLVFFYTKNPVDIPLTWFLLVFFIFSILQLRKFTLKVFPRQDHKFNHIIALFPLLFVLSFGVLLMYCYLILCKKEEAPPYRSLLFISVVLAAFFITIFEGVDFFKHWKKYIIRSEQIEKANLFAQYETLRNQLNPHFLFNGLNTLISFIEEQDVRAAPFAQNLSDFLKYLLTYNKLELISVEQELVVVKQYVYLQSTRFDQNLLVTIRAGQDCRERQIPPLTLQMLVENAIKHNKISSLYRLSIDIYNEDDYLFVKNNIQLKEKVESAHVGIENITGRYRLFTSKEVKIIDSGQDFIIGVPLLQNIMIT
jgi:sensor histidine kinase YesM